MCRSGVLCVFVCDACCMCVCVMFKNRCQEVVGLVCLCMDLKSLQWWGNAIVRGLQSLQCLSSGEVTQLWEVSSLSSGEVKLSQDSSVPQQTPRNHGRQPLAPSCRADYWLRHISWSCDSMCQEPVLSAPESLTPGMGLLWHKITRVMFVIIPAHLTHASSIFSSFSRREVTQLWGEVITR